MFAPVKVAGSEEGVGVASIVLLFFAFEAACFSFGCAGASRWAIVESVKLLVPLNALFVALVVAAGRVGRK